MEEYNIKKIVTIFTMLFIINFGSNEVRADSIDYNIEEVIENMESVNSSEEDIENVIEKLENGESLDSDKYLNELSIQIEDEDLQLSNYGVLNTDLFREKTEEFIRFEDGSFQELTLEVENPNPGAISILSSNGGILSFKPTVRNPVVTASYTANIFIPNDTRSSSYISNLSNWSIRTLGGTYSNRTLSIVRRTEVQRGSLPAVGRMAWEFTVVQGAAQTNHHLTIESGHHIGGRYGIRVTARPIGLVTQ